MYLFCSDLKEECCDRYVVAGGQTACFVCFLDLTLPYVKTECSPCTYNRMLIGSLYRHIIFVEYFSFLLKLIGFKSLDCADGDCKINPLCAATLICCNVLSNLWIKYQADWYTNVYPHCNDYVHWIFIIDIFGCKLIEKVPFCCLHRSTYQSCIHTNWPICVDSSELHYFLFNSMHSISYLKPFVQVAKFSGQQLKQINFLFKIFKLK